MAKLLVTGGAGYVGSHCVKRLATAGHECTVYDNFFRGHREFVKWGPLIEGDVRDADRLAQTFSEHAFDAVLHFAALAYVGESVRDPDLYRDVNEAGTRALLDAMRKAGVSRIVFSSSCAVYGQPASMPITERTPRKPVNPYGETKLACERMMDAFDRDYGLKSVRLRYFNAAGADRECEIGEWHEPETHLIPLVLEAAVGKRDTVEIFGADFPTPDGTALRDYIHVSDLADAHQRALDYLLNGGQTVALNLGTGRGVSVRDVVKAAERVTQRPVPSRIVGRREGDPAELVSDPSEAKRVMGWSAEIPDIDDIVADAWRWREKLELVSSA